MKNTSFKNNPREISAPVEHRYLFTVATMVNRLPEYHEMLDSAKISGFDREDVEFVFVDNSNGNRFDGFSAVNHFLKIASGRYLIICHQDILFEFDDFSLLYSKILEIERLDPMWGVVGNAGKKFNSESVIRITDPGASNLSKGPFPQKVMTLDENFLVVNMQYRLSPTLGVAGFHLYGTDLCCNAALLGLNSYVIDFHLRHKSSGNADESYRKVQKQLIQKYSQRKKMQVVQAMCSRFFVSGSRVLNVVLNSRRLLNLHKSLKKKFSSD